MTKAETIWDYATGALDRPLSAAGSNVRAAIDRWRDLLRDDSVDFEANGLLDGADDPEARLDLLKQLYSAGVSHQGHASNAVQRIPVLVREVASDGERD